MVRDPIVILHTDATERATAVVSARHGDLEIHACDSYAALPDLISTTRAEVVYSMRFAGTPGFPRAALVEGKTVRWVAVGGSGTDHLAPWSPARLTVTNSAGVAADMMAEYVLGCLLAFTLDLRRFARAQAAREWIAGQVAPIAGRTVVVVGLGPTGRSVARLCRAMGMRVLGVRARPTPTPDVDEVHGTEALAELWPRADAVVACVPLLRSTRGLIGRAAFARMRPGAVLVDVSRGGVVDEGALLNSLRSGQLAGAALDVFGTEPLPGDHPFWTMDNVIVTPHCSSVFPGWQTRSVEMFCDNLDRYRQGETLSNIVDPALGY